MKNSIWITMALVAVGCGRSNDGTPLMGTPDDLVVRSRAEFTVTAGSGARSFRANVSQTQPVTVTNAAATSMTLDNSGFVPPTISNAMMDFGNLAISALSDNDLKVCGAGGNQKCGTALIRIFTTGTAGAGLFNSADNYGVPLTAALTTPLTIGLNAAAAAVMQTISIPANKRVVRLSDFSPTPSYNVKADFTDAGTGSFSTTIVVEYALAL